MVQTTYLSDYKEFGGIKIPSKITMNMGMEMEFNLVDAKINEGVSDSDFE
jgi:hypothetical protein